MAGGTSWFVFAFFSALEWSEVVTARKSTSFTFGEGEILFALTELEDG